VCPICLKRVCMCAYVCMHVRMYVCVSSGCVYVCICVCMHVCMCAYVLCACAYVCVCE